MPIIQVPLVPVLYCVGCGSLVQYFACDAENSSSNFWSIRPTVDETRHSKPHPSSSVPVNIDSTSHQCYARLAVIHPNPRINTLLLAPVLCEVESSVSTVLTSIYHDNLSMLIDQDCANVGAAHPRPTRWQLSKRWPSSLILQRSRSR